MAVSRIQNQPIPTTGTGVSPKAKPRPQGLAEMPDRLDDRRAAIEENPPSLFKKFLFEPIFYAIKFILRGIFTFIDFLRDSAFEEKPKAPLLDRESFLASLRAAPRPEKLLLQFVQVYSPEEQNRVYFAIGQSHNSKTSWKEVIWDRSPHENVELGRHLVRQNPFLLRDHLFI